MTTTNTAAAPAARPAPATTARVSARHAKARGGQAPLSGGGFRQLLLGARGHELGGARSSSAPPLARPKPPTHEPAEQRPRVPGEERQASEDPSAAREDGLETAWDPLDPAARHAALLGPPPAIAPGAAPAQELAPRARVSMEELLPQLVRRIAWAGDRRKGTVQLELGAGRHAGTVVTVHADGGRLRVELDGPGDVEELRSRIGERLRRHGLEIESVT